MSEDKYKGKYKISSSRAAWWDYRAAAAYFVTIVTARRRPYFGKIVDRRMEYSNAGVIADILWHEIKNHAKNVELGEFTIMPNHLHGILILHPSDNCVETGHALSQENPNVEQKPETGHVEQKPETGHVEQNPETGHVDQKPETGHVEQNPETGHALSLQRQGEAPHPRFRNPGKNSLSSIVGSYKSAVSRHARRLGFEFGWQTRFYDHIIRSHDEYMSIAQYILDNPSNWTDDDYYGESE